MEEQNRKKIKEYFYGHEWAKFLVILSLPLSVLYVVLSWRIDQAVVLFFIMNFAAGCVKVYDDLFSDNPKIEALYDTLIQEDIEKFKPIALEKLGMTDQHLQIADPLMVYGAYLDYDPSMHERKQSYFEKILDPLPRLILKAGSDTKFRASLVQVTMFYFNQDQLFVYQVNYDICRGDFLEDSTSEYFYGDIDCINTGERLVTEKRKKHLVKKKYQYFKVIVTSGTSTYAISEDEDILSHEVMAMRQLIREQKNNIDELEL